MPSLKDLRNKITSVQSTKKITKAMQMVAVAKLRRAQAAAESARPYAERIETVLANLAGGAGDARGPRLLTGTGAQQTHLLLVCTGERGLCGAFNTSIVRLARERANALIAQGRTVKILCVGKKGHDQLKRQFEQQIVELIDDNGVYGGKRYDENDMHIVCPWHGYEYKLETGECASDAKLRLQRFKVVERDGQVFVAV